MTVLVNEIPRFNVAQKSTLRLQVIYNPMAGQRHGVRLRKPGGFLDEFYLSRPAAPSEGPGPVRVRGPPVLVGGIAMPIDRIAEIRHPPAETKYAPACCFGSEMQELVSLVRCHHAPHDAAHRDWIGKGEPAARFVQEIEILW